MAKQGISQTVKMAQNVAKVTKPNNLYTKTFVWKTQSSSGDNVVKKEEGGEEEEDDDA